MTTTQLCAAANALLDLAHLLHEERTQHPKTSHTGRTLARAAKQITSAGATLQDLAAELDVHEPDPEPNTPPTPE